MNIDFVANLYVMCGIFGFVTGSSDNISMVDFKTIIRNFIYESESRGKEAVGLAAANNKAIKVIKRPWPGRQFIKSEEFNTFIDQTYVDCFNNSSPIALIGHCRLVTNGGSHLHQNNQPVISNGIVGVHNGIIVNADDIYNIYKSIKKDYDVDSEAILDLIQNFREQGLSLPNAISKTFDIIKGEASVAALISNLNAVAIMTNNGSLYYSQLRKYSSFVFASERFILESVMREMSIDELEIDLIKKVYSKSGVIFDYSNIVRPYKFRFASKNKIIYPTLLTDREIEDISPLSTSSLASVPTQYSQKRLLVYDEKLVRNQKRCVKCLLPFSFPFIEFDSFGICNYCSTYKLIDWRGLSEFESKISYSKKSAPTILLALSGGRDSCYALHYLRRVLGLDVVAYTYDWGMVTDLARRNMSRMCADLEVEHILVSADIEFKRRNIKKNVLAWLKRPHLGTVPLFMAGDKQFFYYANKVLEQNKLDYLVFGMNPLEKTEFKVGFCGISKNKANRHYHLNVLNQLKLIMFYGQEFIMNPNYFNSSIFDSAFAYFSYYMTSHNYLMLYQYLKWNEQEIVDTLISQYGWETADDTKTTWRIGDGTASFYNYIYFSVAGFTESETFRSNQIREGMITRAQGLEYVVEENRPRYESIKWYCETNKIDFNSTIDRINKIPKIY